MPKYRCYICEQKFNKLKQCKEHFKQNHPSETVNGLQKRCAWDGVDLYEKFRDGETKETKEPETTLLGFTGEKAVYLDVHEPFCLTICGVQGAGKSHTLSVVLENCLIPYEHGCKKPMTALMFHYDNQQSQCEATGISTSVRKGLKLPQIVVLVSPTFYTQRKRFYSGSGFQVLPLLFDWNSLTAVQIKTLLYVGDGKQLYIDMLLGLLRKYQREGKIPPFKAFCKELCKGLDHSQTKFLNQRLDLLRQFLSESEENKKHKAYALKHLVKCGTMVVADITDPMMAPSDADGIFQVLLQQFRGIETGCGKVVVCDEAHKYFDKDRGLAKYCVETVRLMRHEGIRVIVSTQTPRTMPEELLELTSMTVLHKFHSRDWWSYLSSKLPLPDDGFSKVRLFDPGEALVFTDGEVVECKIRKRITTDKGESNCN